ncbi:MAG: histone family protein [Candidatus Woesearchaeota archaeon]
MTDKILPLAAMERILKKGSPDIRVSEPAKDELRIVLEEYGEEIAKTASKFAIHAGRKTIKAEDIKLALKHGINKS